jgi:voltage-gated potassium channel
MNPLSRLIIPFLMLLVVMTIGVVGYTMLEGFSLLEALYMVVITLSTVGFKEIRELGDGGKILTISIIVMGVGTVAYAVGQFIEIVVEGQIVGYRRRKRMEKKIKELKNHFIICGFGRVGHRVADSLKAHKIPFVIIDAKPETVDELGDTNVPYLIGDASSDELLEAAGVRTAKGLVAANDSDVANVFVTLTARVLNPKLYIVARSAQIESEKKLKKAGANRVISPYFITGQRMATMVLKPVTVDYIDTVMRGEKLEHNIEEIGILKKSKLAGKTIGEFEVRSKTGATVLAVKRYNGSFELHPSAKTKIEAGDTLVVVGTSAELHELESMME